MTICYGMWKSDSYDSWIVPLQSLIAAAHSYHYLVLPNASLYSIFLKMDSHFRGNCVSNVLHGYYSGCWREVQIVLRVGHFLPSLIDCTKKWLKILHITIQSWQCYCRLFVEANPYRKPVLHSCLLLVFLIKFILHMGYWVIVLKMMAS